MPYLTTQEAFHRLREMEENADGKTALEMLDHIVVFYNDVTSEVKTFKGIQKILRTHATEIMEELGLRSQKTEHGRVVITKPGVSRSVDYDALNELCIDDADFAAKYLPHFTETPRKGSTRIT